MLLCEALLQDLAKISERAQFFLAVFAKVPGTESALIASDLHSSY